MLDYEEGTAAVEGEELQAELRELNANANLSEQYLALARDLDVMEPKAPDEVPTPLVCLRFQVQVNLNTVVKP